MLRAVVLFDWDHLSAMSHKCPGFLTFRWGDFFPLKWSSGVALGWAQCIMTLHAQWGVAQVSGILKFFSYPACLGPQIWNIVLSLSIQCARKLILCLKVDTPSKILHWRPYFPFRPLQADEGKPQPAELYMHWSTGVIFFCDAHRCACCFATVWITCVCVKTYRVQLTKPCHVQYTTK